MADQVELAKEIAIEAHKGQTRWNGDDYFEAHVQKVADFVKENFSDEVYETEAELMIAAAFLHDTLEDNPEYTPSVLRSRGVSQEVIDLVLILTKRKGESYFDFIMRINHSGDELAKMIKIADISCNMADTDEKEKKSARYAKYELSRYILSQGLYA
jgi:(p)ppGpp synthase/HD superfamily hydrolase